MLYKIGVLTDFTPEGDIFQSVSRYSKSSLVVTPQGVAPKAGLFLQSVVALRLGGSKSA